MIVRATRAAALLLLGVYAGGVLFVVLAPRLGELPGPAHVRYWQALNLDYGAVNGGSAGLHQELVFRPYPGIGRAGTPVKGLFLANSSAHPGGGVHGAPGSNAARAALAQARLRRI